MEEIWKEIPLLGGTYEVSSLGNVRSKKTKRLRKLCSNQLGHLVCAIFNGKQTLTSFVHRYVALAFIPNPENKPIVNHKNGIKTDNRIENLEWVTAKENSHHAHRTGLIPYKFGENNSYSKLTEKQVLEIVKRYKNKETAKKLAIEYNCTLGNIYNILRGITWKYLNIGIVTKAQNIKIKVADQNGIVYNSIREAADRLNLKRSQIYKSVYNGHFAGTFKFTKLNEEKNV